MSNEEVRAYWDRVEAELDHVILAPAVDVEWFELTLGNGE